MKVPEPHGRAGPCCPHPQAHYQCQGPGRRGSTIQYIFPAQALLQRHFLGSGNLHLMAKSCQERHIAHLVHTVHGEHLGGSDPQQKTAGIQPWPHPVNRGAYAPSGTSGQYEGHRETCGLASASLQSRESLRMALS